MSEQMIEFDLLALKDLTLAEQKSKVKELFQLWDSCNEADKTALVGYLRRKRTLKRDIFSNDDGFLISFLLQEKVYPSLSELEQYLQSSISENRTSITAILLEFKENHFSRTEIDAFHENLELVEMGFEYPTKKQLKEKWRCSKNNKGYQVSGYKGKESVVTLPKQTADGDKIVSFCRISYGDRGLIHNLVQLTIEADLHYIEDYCLSHCGKLEGVILPPNLLFLGSYVFYMCYSLKEVILPDTVTQVGNGLFYGCTNLDSVHLSEKLEAISSDMFSSCCSLTHINLPENLTYIGDCAFNSCDSLTEITIPENVTELGRMVFYQCKNLQKVTILNPNVKFGYGCFVECRGLADENGFIIVGGVLCHYVGTGPVIDVPDHVTSLDDFAFLGADSSAELRFPKNLNFRSDFRLIFSNITIKE